MIIYITDRGIHSYILITIYEFMKLWLVINYSPIQLLLIANHWLITSHYWFLLVITNISY